MDGYQNAKQKNMRYIHKIYTRFIRLPYCDCGVSFQCFDVIYQPTPIFRGVAPLALRQSHDWPRINQQWYTQLPSKPTHTSSQGILRMKASNPRNIGSSCTCSEENEAWNENLTLAHSRKSNLVATDNTAESLCYNHAPPYDKPGDAIVTFFQIHKGYYLNV